MLAVSVTPAVEAAAALVIDTLRKNRTYILIPNNERAATRAIQSILEYFSIRGDDVHALLRVLIEAGEAKAFFNLAIPRNDTGLKAFLLANGVYWESVLMHHDFDAWDGADFLGGLAVGLGASFATILEALWEMFGFLLKAGTQPSEALAQIQKLLAGLKELSAESLHEFARKEWEQWQHDFSEALYELRFGKAGYLLGKLGGDLWQVVTGVKALAKLPGMTLKLARKSGAIFLAGARASGKAIGLLAELIAKLAAGIASAAKVGFAAVAKFFDDLPRLVRELKAGALAVTDDLGRTVFMIPDQGFALANGGRIEAGFVFTESTGEVVAHARSSFDEGWKYLENLIPSISKGVKQVRLSVSFWKDIRELQGVAEEYLKTWRKALGEAMKVNELPLTALDFGKWVHVHVEVWIEDLAKALSKRFTAVAETDISTLSAAVGEGAAELKQMKQRAGTPLLRFVKERPYLMESLGVANEDEIVVYLKKIGGYKNPETSAIGSLRNDAVFYNAEAKTMMVVDYTSGWSKIGFALEYERLVKAGVTLSEPEKLSLAREFLTHSYREYALREAILEHVFKGWQTKVLEVLYTPLTKAEKLVK